MALPKQLQKQVKETADLESAMRKESSELAPDRTQAEIDALLAEVNPPAAPAAPAAAPPDNVTELHPDAPKPERTDWKQKYSVLKGKYDAEVPRLQGELRATQERLNSLEARLTAPPAEPKPAAPQATFTQAEIDEFGADLLDVIGRKAREIVQAEYVPLVTSLKQEISSLEQQVGTTSQRVRKQEQNEVFALLNREVQDWESINKDPAFAEWLDQLDPFAGRSRKTMMLEAFNANDARRVKAFFTGFLQENAAVRPDPTVAPAAPAAPAATTLDLNQYVAPGTPKGGGQSGAPREKRTWTRPEISRFYSDVQKGHYRSRPEDKARIEADIVAATNDGRVVG